jgi:hypothetical protein
VCACAKRTGAAAREALRRDRPGGITSPAFHACGSASPCHLILSWISTPKIDIVRVYFFVVSAWKVSLKYVRALHALAGLACLAPHICADALLACRKYGKYCAVCPLCFTSTVLYLFYDAYFVLECFFQAFRVQIVPLQCLMYV